MVLLEDLDRLFSKRSKILVVGDLMLDHYRIGEATRISPEAPVPILLNPRDEFRLGGAGAVAAMCAVLEADVVAIGIVGSDRSGEQVYQMLTDLGVCCMAIVDPSRVTTVKERICGVASGRHRQQLGRVDCETTTPISDDLADNLAKLIADFAENAPDVILIADYAKGMVTDDVARACQETGAIVIVDPPKHGVWEKFEHVGCIVPNRQESRGRSAAEIQAEFNTLAAVVKLDQDGCELFEVQDGRSQIRARPRFVHDVTGAGDQFIAVLGCVIAAGGDWQTAAELANVAAGLQVERHGCVPVTLQEIRVEVENDFSRQTAPAI